jgi:hypothetical protein
MININSCLTPHFSSFSRHRPRPKSLASLPMLSKGLLCAIPLSLSPVSAKICFRMRLGNCTFFGSLKCFREGGIDSLWLEPMHYLPFLELTLIIEEKTVINMDLYWLQSRSICNFSLSWGQDQKSKSYFFSC